MAYLFWHLKFQYINAWEVDSSILEPSKQSQSKMKLSLLFVAILGVATVSAVPAVKARSTRSLSDDWQDFYALVDTDKVIEIFIQYLAEDAEVQAVVAYIQTDNFKALVLALEAIPEYIAFLDYLDAAGLNIYYYINVIHGIIGLPELRIPTTISVSRLASTRITGGIAGLWADIKATLPLADLRALFDEKLQSSPDFANLIALLSSEKAQTIYDALKANEEYQYIRASLEAFGINVDYAFSWLKALIGWA